MPRPPVAVAIKTMNKVASHINEMQKIHEEFGAVFDQLIAEQTGERKEVRTCPPTPFPEQVPVRRVGLTGLQGVACEDCCRGELGFEGRWRWQPSSKAAVWGFFLCRVAVTVGSVARVPRPQDRETAQRTVRG